jgi:cell division protease FtsH
MNSIIKTVIFWAVIVVSALLLGQVVRSGADKTSRPLSEISYSAFLAQVAAGHVSSVAIAGNEVRGVDDKGANFHVVVPSNQTRMLDALQQHGVEIWIRETSQGSWPSWLLNLAPLILLGALWFFMIRQMRMHANRQQDISASTAPNPVATIWPLKDVRLRLEARNLRLQTVTSVTFDFPVFPEKV